MWCSEIAWCSGLAACATATTKQRSKKSSSGVETRWLSSAERPASASASSGWVWSPRLTADEIPGEQHERRLRVRSGLPVRGQRRIVVGLGAHPDAVAAALPGDPGQRPHQL